MWDLQKLQYFLKTDLVTSFEYQVLNIGFFFLISVQLAVNCIFILVCLSLNILLSIFCTLRKELPEIHVQLGKVQKSLSSRLLHWFGDSAVFAKTVFFLCQNQKHNMSINLALNLFSHSAGLFIYQFKLYLSIEQSYNSSGSRCFHIFISRYLLMFTCLTLLHMAL